MKSIYKVTEVLIKNRTITIRVLENNSKINFLVFSDKYFLTKEDLKIIKEKIGDKCNKVFTFEFDSNVNVSKLYEHFMKIFLKYVKSK